MRFSPSLISAIGFFRMTRISQRKNNRQRIVDSALDLFNSQGSARISTNHIATEAGVSPGNLYYHFRNKGEIIRELYQSFVDEYGQLWRGLQRGPLGVLQISDIIADGFVINWRYRFIALELVALCQQDPLLQKMQRETHEERFALIHSVVHRAAEQGVFVLPEDETCVEDLVHAEWLVNQFWLPYLSVQSDRPTREQMRQGIRIAIRLIEPYLAPMYRTMLFEYFDREADLREQDK